MRHASYTCQDLKLRESYSHLICHQQNLQALIWFCCAHRNKLFSKASMWPHNYFVIVLTLMLIISSISMPITCNNSFCFLLIIKYIYPYNISYNQDNNGHAHVNAHAYVYVYVMLCIWYGCYLAHLVQAMTRGMDGLLIIVCSFGVNEV